MSRNNLLMDHTVPRPAPRIAINPSPFTFDKPTPQVPDVSLIFDSSGASSNNNKTHNSSGSSHSAPVIVNKPSSPNEQSLLPLSSQQQPVQYMQPSNFEIRVLYDVMKKQEETILRLENQVKLMHENQEAQWKNMQSMLATILDRVKVETPAKTEQSAQTEELVVTKEGEKDSNKRNKPESSKALPSRPSPGGVVTAEVRTNNQVLANLPGIERSRSASNTSSSSTSSSSSIVVQENVQTERKFSQQQQGPSQPRAGRADEESKIEDLSTILKDLQLPTIQENSMFSEVSIRSIDMQEYNDSFNDSKSDVDGPDVGPSASNFGSSDEEEVVQPTVTFYRNVIGNVNKMLEGNQEITMYGSTDTTVYGMSSTNLSFATKQYLQKYGLVKHREAPKESVERNQAKETTRKQSSSNNNRILDMKALKNKPKLV